MKSFKKIGIIALSIILVVVIAGAVVYGMFGKAQNVEARGRVEVRVSLSEEYEDSKLKNTAEKDIKAILTNKGYKVLNVTTEVESKVYNTLVFCVEGNNKLAKELAKETDGTIYSSIKTYLETNGTNGYVFNDDENVKEYRVDYVGNTFATSILRKSFIAIAIVVGITFIYFAIRFGILSAIASSIATVLELGLFIAVVVLTRIPTDGMLYLALYSTLVFSLLASLIYNGLFRRAIKTTDKPLQENAIEVSSKGAKLFSSIVVVGIIGLLIAIIAIPSTLKLVFAQIALGVLLVGVSAILVRPALRYWLGSIKKEKKSGYEIHAKQKENKDI